MDIDDFIESSLIEGSRPPLDKCPHCDDLWHGLSRPGCRGGWLDVEAIQNQGAIGLAEYGNN